MIPDPATLLTADECVVVIKQRYRALQAIWTARSHSHEQQSALMAEIRVYADRVRELQKDAAKTKGLSRDSTARP